MQQDAQNSSNLKSRLTQLLASNWPSEYKAIRNHAMELKTAMQEYLASMMRAPLISEAKQMDGNSYDTKLSVANFISDELHDLGLSVMCPATNSAARLSVVLKAKPHFVLHPDGWKHRISHSSVEMPELQLVPAPLPRIGVKNYWREKRQQQKGGMDR